MINCIWRLAEYKSDKVAWSPTGYIECNLIIIIVQAYLKTLNLCEIKHIIRLEGPEDPHLRNSRFRRSRDPAHASIPLAQTPWGLTGRAWLQAGAQWVVIVVFPPLNNSLGIDSRNVFSVIYFAIYGAVCFQFTQFPCDDWENIYFVLLSASNRKYELLPIV